ncbi:hypothetical protein [Polymorphospora lycopeni]|uniref:Uncharacterized protein n=1 Tax=Polymorphospora lycopeni TaxID=3140240 RepID=A0ABV5CLG3_9ACTN
MTNRYTWEIQRRRHGIWSHQVIAGEPEDPRGHEQSNLTPDDFAREIAARHQPAGQYQVMLWDRSGVGSPPVAVYNPDGLEPAIQALLDR